MPRKKKAEAPPSVDYCKRAVDTLVYDDQNPRVRNERNLAAIRSSVREHGQVEPVLVQASTGRVVHGNGRLQVMVEEGFTDVDCAVIDVDDAKARKLSIVLNRSGELAGWNVDVLGAHLEALASIDTSFDPTSMGFSGSELEDILADANAVVEELMMADAPDPHKETVVTGSKDGEYESVPGMKPEDIKETNIRLVQLFLTNETINPFNEACRVIAAKTSLTNVTDVVYTAVMNEAAARNNDITEETVFEINPTALEN